jgi:hypothetical protein
MKQNYPFFLTGLALGILFSACTCSPEGAPEKLLGLSAEAPIFLGHRVLAGGIVEFRFSRPVSLRRLDFDPPAEASLLEEGETLRVSLAADLPGGSRISADLLVEDEESNTLEALILFRTRNDHMPSLVINEIRTEYSNPRCEFIELKTAGPGNLGGLRVVTAMESAPVYEFNPAETAGGEYIVLHLRKLDSESIDESGDDLGASGGYEASEARDFWIPSTSELLRKTDGLALVDQDGVILDGIIFSETAASWWAREDLARFAEFLSQGNAWQTAGDPPLISPAEAFSSQGTTATRTLCRDESTPDSGGPQDWYIAATSQATPGRRNTGKRYVP